MIPKGEQWTAVGKRKSSIARVVMTPGTGRVLVRKWRTLPLDENLEITYTGKNGESITEKAIFPKGASTDKWHVPRTAKGGKTPFKYTPDDEYFRRPTLSMIVEDPFVITGTKNQFDVWINVTGGGLSGQAGAIRHGISKALVAYELSKGGAQVVSEDEEGAELPFRLALKRAGYLTRDSRIKERKKYGQPGARKKFQYSKR